MELEIDNGEIIYRDELYGNSFLVNEYSDYSTKDSHQFKVYTNNLTEDRKSHNYSVLEEKDILDKKSINNISDDIKGAKSSIGINNDKSLSPRLQFSISEPRASSSKSNKLKHSVTINNHKSEIFKNNDSLINAYKK